jgi:ketosteroid isomerase-like protein
MRPVLLTFILILMALPMLVLAETDVAAEVRLAEGAFAQSMISRDLEGFKNYLDPEAVFFGKGKVLTGRDEIVRAWSVYFKGDQAPFTWEPETVEVLNSGYLALSSGPVYDKQGKRIATYNTVWRKSPIGRWLVVFDKGCVECTE